jgi:hypothetical protein
MSNDTCAEAALPDSRSVVRKSVEMSFLHVVLLSAV